ncbi:phosphonate ABC transporter, permease protein PhnE [Ligilactobacillus saerimneri]|uniref:phosphonate ABC transporter, permease protein PhnE n=1 Tax=Ligilactobacillus saerimneri TaxID=228229 RepID=UPI0022A77C30|nr:phosphonate ABC transporter, permease protein PhnE [Ligilactobacillus saerimneri]MCZ0891474.1 phosphonate ABC transporter, permease protein PhnE [Ligilactobacillus saerimneri]
MNNEIPKRTFVQKYHLVGWGWTILFVILLGLSSAMTGVDWGTFFTNLNQFFVLVEQMASPAWDYIDIIWQPLLETIQMALIGTTIGTVLAVPFAIIAARNIVKNKVVRSVIRLILNLVRTLPDLLLAALFVAIVGIGPTAGVWTLAVFSFGMVSKLFYEAIETIDEGPLEALRAAGANKMQIIIFAVLPQILNNFVSYFLYTFEINVRASTILGYLGAGGIGVYLQRSLSSFQYEQTGVIVIVIFAVVIIIDGFSNWLREKLV